MLVLTRNINESFLIGDSVVTIIAIKGKKGVKIGIDADKKLNVVRSELLCNSDQLRNSAVGKPLADQEISS